MRRGTVVGTDCVGRRRDVAAQMYDKFAFLKYLQWFPIDCKVLVVELLASRACFMETSRRRQEI